MVNTEGEENGEKLWENRTTIPSQEGMNLRKGSAGKQWSL
jgi:hypothetical protein